LLQWSHHQTCLLFTRGARQSMAESNLCWDLPHHGKSGLLPGIHSKWRRWLGEGSKPANLASTVLKI
jgi:hypothetical protein